MIKVKDERGLARDPNSKAILNVDADALRDHRRRRQMIRKLHEDSSKVSTLQTQIEQQANQIAELQKLVQALLDK